jgi:hypothetical protein
MNTIARNLSIFVLMAAAVTTALTTALTIVATTTLAASNTHAHDIQLMGKDDSWGSFTHHLIRLVMSVVTIQLWIQLCTVWMESPTPASWFNRYDR